MDDEIVTRLHNLVSYCDCCRYEDWFCNGCEPTLKAISEIQRLRAEIKCLHAEIKFLNAQINDLRLRLVALSIPKDTDRG